MRTAIGCVFSRMIAGMYAGGVNPLAAISRSRAIEARFREPFFLPAPGRLPPLMNGLL